MSVRPWYERVSTFLQLPGQRLLTESHGHKQAVVLATLVPFSGSYFLCKFLVLVLISVVTVSLAVMFWHSEERCFHFQQRKIHWIKARGGQQSAAFILLNLPPISLEEVLVANVSVGLFGWFVMDLNVPSDSQKSTVYTEKQLSSLVSTAVVSELQQQTLQM